jgi:hypothetical protein
VNDGELGIIITVDKQGFPALDYLINGLSTTDALIVTQYTTNVMLQNIKSDRCYYSLKIQCR